MNLTSKTQCPTCGDSLMFKKESPGSSKSVEVRCLSNYLGECGYREAIL